MPHQTQLEKKKYRNWVQAGLGLKYVKEGLQSFCEDIVQQQHDDIINNIKHDKNLSTVTCGQCSLKDLMPDHMKLGNKQCPLGQVNCNCWYPAGKIPCPNNVCGAIYDRIIKSHGSTPPAPYWKNTDIQKWATDPWSIAKCFINAPGYDQKSSAAETDCTGLLHLITNNTELHNHIRCKITTTDIFSKVRDCRNKIFHSSTMELDHADVDSYIADMKAVLQDGMELKHRKDSQAAVKNLQELKTEDFIITTKCEAEVFSASMEAIKARQRELEEKIDETEKKTKDTVDNLPTKEDLRHVEERMQTLESDMTKQKEEIKKIKEDQLKFKEELENLKAIQSSHKEQNDYIQTKLDFQRDLIEYYKEKLLKVSVLPLNPRRNVTEFTNVYIKPKMVIERDKTRSEQPGEIEMSSMHEMFVKDGRPLKSIYVLGEAGSGKSTFCKSLVNYWCLAHSDQQVNEDEFEGFKEIRKFELLFHISLRHVSDKTSIREMLRKQYGRLVPEEVLDHESRTCLIILDGLDEWNPGTIEPSPYETKGLPIREQFKNYTVITTSRPWKIETVQISENELDLKVRLKEFCEIAVKTMIERTVNTLNESLSGNKIAKDCENQIKGLPVSDIKYTPIMLQQLICIWFDGNLHGTSRCAIYSAMLELFFEWNAKVSQNDPCFVEMKKLSTGLRDVQLPETLNDIKACRTYKYLIESMSRLAYETLFNNKKEMSVSFDSSSFQRFNVSENTITCCLKLGILSEDKEESLTASKRQRSIYSFVHKSEQEFLAAVYVALHTQAMAEKADIPEGCTRFVDTYFKCMTVDDILDKANVFIMLCGLVPRLATYISQYIYIIVNDYKCVLKYRTSVNSEFVYLYTYYYWKTPISNIQDCIFSCIEEVLACDTNCKSKFYLGDVIINTEKKLSSFLLFCDQKVILLNEVMSFCLETVDSSTHSKEDIYSLFKCLSESRRLVAVKINSQEKFINDESDQCIHNILDANILTLKSISVDLGHISETSKMNPTSEAVIRRLRSMTSLVALRINDLNMSHEQSSLLVSFLSQTDHVEQISISIKCDCRQEHDLDLSKNKNLQGLEVGGMVYLTSVKTSNLEEFICSDITDKTIEQIVNIQTTAYKLKKLELRFKLFSLFNHDSVLVTNKLIALLTSLHQLRELRLYEFIFTDNIITCPSEMKHLEIIDLFIVTMGMTTWRKFVDSLIEIPRSINMRAGFIRITQDGEEGNCDKDRLEQAGGEETAAFQYVRENSALFSVKTAMTGRSLSFSTKR